MKEKKENTEEKKRRDVCLRALKVDAKGSTAKGSAVRWRTAIIGIPVNVAKVINSAILDSGQGVKMKKVYPRESIDGLTISDTAAADGDRTVYTLAKVARFVKYVTETAERAPVIDEADQMCRASYHAP